MTAPVPPISSSPGVLTYGGQSTDSSELIVCAAPVGSSTRSPGISWIGSCSGTHIHAVPDGDGVKRRAVALRQREAPRRARPHAGQQRAAHAGEVEDISERIHETCGQEYAI